MCLNDSEYVDCTKEFPELLQQDINESRKRLRSRTEYFKENIDELHTELIFQIATSANLNKEEETLDYIKTNFSKETVVRIMKLLGEISRDPLHQDLMDSVEGDTMNMIHTELGS